MSDSTSPTGAVGRFHLAALAERAVELQGEHQSLLFEGTWHTNTELRDRAARVAGGLRELGIEPGDRVMVLMTNTPEVFISYQAIWRAGAVVMPVIFLQSPPELRHILVDSGCKAAIVTPELLGLVMPCVEGLDVAVVVVGDAPPEAAAGTTPYAVLEAAAPIAIVPRADDDLAALLYTGGTTGRSKGVMLSHQGLWTTGQGLHQVADTGETSRSLLPLPLSHAYGMIVVIAGMHSTRPGLDVVQRWFDAAGWVALVEEHRLETSSVVPSMLTRILAEPLEEHDLSSLTSLGSGGAPLPDAVRREVHERLGAVVREGYGLTESSAVVSASSVDDVRPGSVGKALPHVEVRIAGPDGPDGPPAPTGEDGEICVRGAGVMLGYWGAPEQTASTVVDGWLRTGDVGHLDDDGYLYIVDRIKDLIIRGGFNVYPRDVEDALLTHPGVTSVAVVGRPDADRGEEVVAVVAVDPAAGLTADDLVAYAKTRLARHKYPREIRIVDAVPLTSVGKTDRKAVRALLADP